MGCAKISEGNVPDFNAYKEKNGEIFGPPPLVHSSSL